MGLGPTNLHDSAAGEEGPLTLKPVIGIYSNLRQNSLTQHPLVPERRFRRTRQSLSG